MAKISIKGAVRSAKAEEKRALKAAEKAGFQPTKTLDSLQNFAANLGIGTDNLSSYSGYGFNPISRIRILLEWIYRGSWLGGMAVNVVADDMTRAGVDVRGDVRPEDIEHLERAAITHKVWTEVNNTVKWARLYGGCICVMLIDGQRMDTPLRLDTVGKGQFKGLLTLDRWMVDPDLSRLVREFGPDLGTPEFYNVVADAPALPRMKIHYTRCLRLYGIELPYNQRMMENLWGISVLERLYDRMVAFDSATTGVSQLIYKAYLRVVRIKNMREIVAAGGEMMGKLVQYVDLMRRFQSLEGITMLDSEDEATAMPSPTFSGLSEALIQLGQQLGGALGIPLVRLFGQSPVGMNATGESDMRLYYDSIKQQQVQTLLVPLTRIYRAMAQSEGIKLPEGFTLDFRSLWVLSDEQKAGIGSTDATSVTGAYNAGIISPQTALKELRQLSKISGRFTNVTDEDIKAASEETGAQMQQAQTEQMLEQGGESHELELARGEKELKAKPNGKAA
jgi:phage-related protein (TIGR01555 family)